MFLVLVGTFCVSVCFEVWLSWVDGHYPAIFNLMAFIETP